MERVLVEILVPAINQVFDMFIPLDEQLGMVVYLVGNLIEHLTDGNFKYSSETILCNAQSGEIYDINIIIDELDIKNGSQFILI